MNLPPNNLAAVYRRVSTDQQDASLEAQEARINDYARFKGLALDARLEFSDPATSGGTAIAERKGAATMMNMLRLGEARHLIVAKLDRLGRSAVDVLGTVQELDRLGVALHIVDMGGESLSTVGPIGKFMLCILAGVAELEREMIRGRIKDVLGHKFNAGKLIGTVPFGWNACYRFADGHQLTAGNVLARGQGRVRDGQPAVNDLAPLEAEHGALQECTVADNAVEQHWLWQMHCWRSVVGWNWHKIAVALNQAGVTSKGGRAWDTGNVKSALTNKHTTRWLARRNEQAA